MAKNALVQKALEVLRFFVTLCCSIRVGTRLLTDGTGIAKHLNLTFLEGAILLVILCEKLYQVKLLREVVRKHFRTEGFLLELWLKLSKRNPLKIINPVL